MNPTRQVRKSYIIPLTALLVSLAGSVFAQAFRQEKTVPLEKQRVIAQARLTATRDLHQIVTWQTANPAGGHLPYAKAHLAIRKAGRAQPFLWQTDGGEEQYLVDAVQIVDLDNDRVPEILSLWWVGASAGAVLRAFHWDVRQNTFVEIPSADNLGGVHRYKIVAAPDARQLPRVLIYARSVDGAGQRIVATEEYELRGGKLTIAQKGIGGKPVNPRQNGESGIEGEAVIGPTRPVSRVGDTTPDVAPYQTTLVIAEVRTGREAARVQTGVDGKFRVTLPPGEYVVKPPLTRQRIGARATEQRVSVQAGKFSRVRMTFDNGMR